MESIGDVLFVVGVWTGILGLFGGLFYFFAKANTMKPDMLVKWQAAEMLLGLKLKSPWVGYPRLEGRYDNQNVRLQPSPASYGDHPAPEQTHYTVYHQNKKMPILRLEMDNDFFFTRDKKVGDSEFDDKFHIAYANQKVVQSLFDDPALREEILALTRPVIYMNRNRVVISEVGVQDDPKLIKHRLELTLALTERVMSLHKEKI